MPSSPIPKTIICRVDSIFFIRVAAKETAGGAGVAEKTSPELPAAGDEQ